MNITFRKLQLSDLPLMHTWLNSPHVHEWYDKDKNNSIEEVTNRYAPKIKGEKPTDCYLALFKGEPFGYLQTYKVNDWPEFGNYIGYDDFTASVDLFIGEADFIGRGLGSKMLEAFLLQVVFAEDTNVETCVIGPEPANTRAIHTYEKVGFKYTRTVQIPGEDQPTYLLEITKDQFMSLIKSNKF